MHALWMVLAAFLFASMGVCVKLGSAWFNPAELVFWRGIVGMLMLWLLARSQGVTLATRHPAQHAWRSLVGVVSLGAWFYAIAHLPLATALTLNYMSSIWIAAFIVGAGLWAWHRRRGAAHATLSAPLLLTVLAGFAGVVLMLRPSIAQTPQQALGSALGLLSGLMAALAYLQVGRLARLGEPESRTVFYFALGSALAGGAATLAVGHSPWPGWPALWLLPIGILAALGQLCMTQRALGAQHPGGGQPAVFGRGVRGLLQRVAVRRAGGPAGLGRHGPDRGQRYPRHRAACARCARRTVNPAPPHRRPTATFQP